MKVLLIRFSSFGDVVLTTPLVRTVKIQLDAEVHYLIKPKFIEAICANPYIDNIHLLGDNYEATIRLLKKENYDLILDLQKNLLSYRISTRIGVKTLRFDKLNIKKWMAVKLKWNALPAQKHLVDRYFEAFTNIGIKDDGLGLDYFMKSEDAAAAETEVKNLGNYAVLVLGATYYTKRIPIEKCRELITSISHPVVLLGGEDTKEVADVLTEAFPKRVLNYCGKVSFGVSAGIIKYANLVITGDTGLMHIAAALQKPMFVLWGNTIPAFGMFPYYGYKNIDKAINSEVSELSCRPCGKLGFDKCPKGHFKCMMDQNVEILGTTLH